MRLTKTNICTYAICAAVIAMQIAFLLIPSTLLAPFSQVVRPLFYAVAVIIVFTALGRRMRRTRVAYQSNAAAILSLILFASAIIAVSFFFGGGQNGRMTGLGAFTADMWSIGIPLILAEIVRFRLVKSLNARDNASAVAICVIIVAFAFAQMGELRILGIAEGQLMYIGFSTILPAVTASAVVTYIAFKGTMLSAIGVSFIYNAGVIFSPVLPDVTRLVWALMMSALLFFTTLIFKAVVTDATPRQKRMERAVKYESGRGIRLGFSLTLSAFIVAFFLQAFPIYPVVILTGSMTGYIDRGSIAIMRRLSPDETRRFVQVGDVLHYHCRDMQLVHRVVDTTYDDEGRRVFVTQGDANPFPDPLLLHGSNVIGRHMFSIPFLGYPNVLLRMILSGGAF